MLGHVSYLEERESTRHHSIAKCAINVVCNDIQAMTIPVVVAVEDFILMSRQPTSNENMCRVAAMVFFSKHWSEGAY